MNTAPVKETGSRRDQIPDRRGDFPSLLRTQNGFPLAFLDGPAGTQVPQPVIDAIARHYTTCNANTHGQFPTSVESDRMLEEARAAVADFLGAPGPACVSFGANMTTLAYALARAFARSLRPGDEVVITQLDHEANRGPWLALGEHGVVVREVAIRKDATLDPDDFARAVGPRTRLVAVTMASNAFGTVNDIAFARDLARRAGALLLVDAVHYAPHFPLDVRGSDVDLLLCSAYKFYGPHVGILYAREGLLDGLEPDRLRVQDQRAPWRIETGTLNHAAIAGVAAAVGYIATCGTGGGRRARLVSGMEAIGDHECRLARRLYEGLRGIDRVAVHGPSFDVPRRAPTVSFTVEGKTPADVSARLGERGICTWDGNFYAVRPMEVLGLQARGGVTRAGISLYNTDDEIARLLRAVGEIVRG
ncbi:MAG TPA: cysteine desulfurase-like protein [Bacteroidota bacterium]|nr:cysteine desulfurase-like protein [Bacteroidota bacterium]